MWLDCDPGHDDAMAIILAGHTPARNNLLGVSTVYGNQTLEKVTLNAARQLHALNDRGAHVHVFAGSPSPLVREAKNAPEIHGESGLGGTERLPAKEDLDASLVSSEKAVTAMWTEISAVYATSGKRMHVVATGPLTNVALLLKLYPEVAERIERFAAWLLHHVHGRRHGVGNTGPCAEFNIQNDPEAAKIVCDSGLKVVMVPLEVTHTALVTDAVLASIRTRLRYCTSESRFFFPWTYQIKTGQPDPPLHDPCAVAAVLWPELFRLELLRVDVECASPLSFGQARHKS
ncbi:Inosine/uridine-preferring nucleoside hydrolase domain-containing protein [Baffinella frigidus]|nr:Inosine/uridine-preferring nucleoside hydrolase domain-containing protein [Cryptophyta sp. CCMP2293]